jgi:hypothetical protein
LPGRFIEPRPSGGVFSWVLGINHRPDEKVLAYTPTANPVKLFDAFDGPAIAGQSLSYRRMNHACP